MNKEIAIAHEIEALHDAIASKAINWVDFATDKLKTAMKPFKPDNVVFHLPDFMEGKAAGYWEEGDIQMPVGEIEVQFNGEPSDYFEDLDDWTISGDLAYCTLESVAFKVDIEGLIEALTDWES